MSIFGSMKTAVSGMNAQANKLSTVSDNIANVNTTGYKSASTSFSSLILPSGGGNYNSGSVETNVSYSVTQQGDTISTSSSSNLSIQGAGFFVVQGADGKTVLTRAGDFTPDANGNLVNSAGYTLMGYSYQSGAPAVVVNGFDGLIPILELKDRLDLKELPEEDRGRYNTLAGMVMLLLGRLPHTTDSVDWEGWRFEVVDLDGKRVDKVLVNRLQEGTM